MALSKYNGFVAGNTLPAENANSVDPDNIESPVSGEAFRIIRTNASGLLPDELLAGVDGSGLVNLKIGELELSASDVLRVSDDSEIIGSNTVYEKHREISLKVPGVVRVKFDLAKEVGSGATVYGRIYLNGVAVGTERSSVSSDYATFSEDITLPRNTSENLIQIYTKSSSDSVGQEARTRNFRLYFDNNIVYGKVISV